MTKPKTDLIDLLVRDALWFITGISLGVLAVTLYIDQTRMQFYSRGPVVAEIIAR